MAAQMTKSQLIEKIAAENEMGKKDVKGVLETLATIGYKELKKTGVFLVPGFAKFVVIKKPATKARQGTNPFSGEPMMFKAKPARKIVRARPVKAAKDAVSRSIALGRSGRQDWTAFSRSRRKYFSTAWLIRRDSCAASPSVSMRNQVLPSGASQTYCISISPVLRSPQF